jgi:curved DNA-binding protein CbpA
MNANDFVDYYELLELSPKASFDTIERVFRYLATVHHPDFAQDVDLDKHHFSQIIEAFETLRHPESRANYDVLLQLQQDVNLDLVGNANEAEQDCEVRSKILSIFYGQRRKDIKEPGVSVGRIEDLTGVPDEVLAFHLWYFREQGWIAREESGVMAITAKGVDQIESQYKAVTPNENVLHIEHKPHSRHEASDLIPAKA